MESRRTVISKKCICGVTAEIHGSDFDDTEGPWFIECPGCGLSSLLWAYRCEAWRNFRAIVRKKIKNKEEK
jgi:hypothetical protein